ncbi:CDP-archaeol synthase [Candidatus Woesearchaeota archaeon]|nr:CDP-archaeol synthase [Candidatus Woesearchaeota archaeon]
MGFLLMIAQALYFMLPAYAANMAPVLFKSTFKPLAKPIAPKIKLRGKSLFGAHKTFRGLLVAGIAGILVFLLQEWLYNLPLFQSISLFDYDSMFQAYSVLPGFLLGFGAIFGDLIESAVKRQLDIKPGAKFMPWDQIDFVIGSLIFLAVLYVPSWQVVLIILVLTPALHIAANHLGYYLKLKKVKW